MKQSIVKAVNKLAEESKSLDFELMTAYKLIVNYQHESGKQFLKWF